MTDTANELETSMVSGTFNNFCFGTVHDIEYGPVKISLYLSTFIYGDGRDNFQVQAAQHYAGLDEFVMGAWTPKYGIRG